MRFIFFVFKTRYSTHAAADHLLKHVTTQCSAEDLLTLLPESLNSFTSSWLTRTIITALVDVLVNTQCSWNFYYNPRLLLALEDFTKENLALACQSTSSTKQSPYALGLDYDSAVILFNSCSNHWVVMISQVLMGRMTRYRSIGSTTHCAQISSKKVLMLAQFKISSLISMQQ